jgi:hypothetical protein
MNASVCTVNKIEHHDVVRFGIFADEFPDKGLQEGTTLAEKTLEDATESCMIEVTAEA